MSDGVQLLSGLLLPGEGNNYETYTAWPNSSVGAAASRLPDAERHLWC